jgi:hypothetical protein
MTPNVASAIAPARASGAALEPQAALETAAMNAICQQLGYTRQQCQRMYNAEPPPNMGLVFVAVWAPGGRESIHQTQTCLDEMFNFNVTVTVKFKLPFDRWLEHRDDLEKRCNAIRALMHMDSYDNRIIRAANLLARFDDFSDDEPSLHVGFRESITFMHLDDIQDVGGAWFKSHVDKPECGGAQTIKFGKVRRLQGLLTMQ